MANQWNWQLYQLAKDKYNFKITSRWINDVRRLQNGEPLDYIIGWRPFLNCRIDLSYRPLIPRPETEYWTEKLISELKTRKYEVKVLDIFAGSGCIGVAVLKNIKKVKVDFADNDNLALKQIRKNLKINQIAAGRCRVISSDVFKNLKGKYDIIAANPPYIAFSRKNKVAKEVLCFEPHGALFGGRDGLFYIEKIFKQAANYLKPEGEIWLEFDAPQKPAIAKIAQHDGYQCDFFKDQFNRWRYLRASIAKAKAAKNNDTSRKTISMSAKLKTVMAKRLAADTRAA